jgi:hypothetical protein
MVPVITAAFEAHPLAAVLLSLAWFSALNCSLRQLLAPYSARMFSLPACSTQASEQLGVFVNHAVTIFHVVVTSIGVCHMLWAEDGLALLRQDPLGGQLAAFEVMYPFSFGYVIYDTVDLFRTYSSKARSSPPIWILVHHLALLGGGVFSCAVGMRRHNNSESLRWLQPSQCAAQPLIMLLYTNEFNSLFMLNRVLLRVTGGRIAGVGRWNRHLQPPLIAWIVHVGCESHTGGG